MIHGMEDMVIIITHPGINTAIITIIMVVITVVIMDILMVTEDMDITTIITIPGIMATKMMIMMVNILDPDTVDLPFLPTEAVAETED